MAISAPNTATPAHRFRRLIAGERNLLLSSCSACSNLASWRVRVRKMNPFPGPGAPPTIWRSPFSECLPISSSPNSATVPNECSVLHREPSCGIPEAVPDRTRSPMALPPGCSLPRVPSSLITQEMQFPTPLIHQPDPQNGRSLDRSRPHPEALAIPTGPCARWAKGMVQTAVLRLPDAGCEFRP